MSESHVARADRRARQALDRLGGELRDGRLAAGLTLREIAPAVGLSTAEASRIERGAAPWVSLETLTRYGAIVGLDLWTRLYPGGEPARDAAHLALLMATRPIIGPGLAMRTEVPIGDARDQRAWDVVITDGRGDRAAMELETRIVDVQALLRRLALKHRDGGIETIVLVLADTRSNRAAHAAARAAFDGDYPLDDATLRRTLEAGRLPSAGGVLFVRVRRSPPAT